MTPELNEDEMRLLHREALELYDLYFKPDAKHKIGVGDDIAEEIFKSKFLPTLTDVRFTLDKMHSWLSRCCTASWSSTRFSLLGPTKFKARLVL